MSIKWGHVRSGRVDISRLEEAKGWLGLARTENAEHGSLNERDEPTRAELAALERDDESRAA